jgi:hypothetical protein
MNSNIKRANPMAFDIAYVSVIDVHGELACVGP